MTTREEETLAGAHQRCESFAEQLTKAADASAELARLCYESQRRARESAELAARLQRQLARSENVIDGLRAYIARMRKLLAGIGGTEGGAE